MQLDFKMKRETLIAIVAFFIGVAVTLLLLTLFNGETKQKKALTYLADSFYIELSAKVSLHRDTTFLCDCGNDDNMSHYECSDTLSFDPEVFIRDIIAKSDTLVSYAMVFTSICSGRRFLYYPESSCDDKKYIVGTVMYKQYKPMFKKELYKQIHYPNSDFVEVFIWTK